MSHQRQPTWEDVISAARSHAAQMSEREFARHLLQFDLTKSCAGCGKRRERRKHGN